MWQTSAGTWVQIVAIDNSYRTQRVYNLTVDSVHTYFVAGGEARVLVHNMGCPTADALRSAPHPSKVDFSKLNPQEDGS